MEYQRRIAIIVAIDQYQDGIPTLKTPVADGQVVEEILRSQHGYETHLLCNQQATKRALITMLEKDLADHVSSQDCVLFYFAGHGVALNGEEGPAGYLIPQDARLGEVNTYLSMTTVHDALHLLPCQHFLGILDCCFAGSFRWSSHRDISIAELGVIHKERFERFTQDPAWQIITSAAHDQTALDAFSLRAQQREQIGNHSPFAAALIEALQGDADAYPVASEGKAAGDGIITASELYMYLRDRVEISTESQDRRQTPGIHALQKHDKGEYIFFTPGHTLNLPPAPPLDPSSNPYQGLNAFEEEHNELFFGRDQLSKKLLDNVKVQSLTVVLGASGSGKSSLVKAGLLPRLRQTDADKWCVLSPMRPSDSPFQSLNKSLASVDGLPVDPSQRTLSESIAIWRQHHPNKCLLLVIDQSEEFITQGVSATARQSFFEQILYAMQSHKDALRVVLTLRSDFEPQIRDAFCAIATEESSSTQASDSLQITDAKTFNHNWQQSRFIVPAMTRPELREAIEKPAEARVLCFDPHSLVEQLIDEVANMPGALPLLSFALSELYLKYLERQQQAQSQGIVIDRSLTQADYDEIGGVVRSLTQRANQEYEILCSQHRDYKQTIRNVMLRMVTVSGELARRRVFETELCYLEPENSRVQQVISRFIDARLLVTGTDAAERVYYEPAHDVLVRGWESLLTWQKEAKTKLTLQRRLTPAAMEWASIEKKSQNLTENFSLSKSAQRYSPQDKRAQFLWNANPYLAVLKETLETDARWFNQIETAFIQQSLKQKQKNTRSRRSIFFSTAIGLSILATATVIGQRSAQVEQVNSLQSSAEIDLSAGRDVEALTNSLQAANLLKHGRMVKWFKPEESLNSRVRLSLQKSLNRIKEQNRISFLDNTVSRNVATGSDLRPSSNARGLFSPDGQKAMIIQGPAGRGSQSIRLWDWRTRKLTAIPLDKQLAIQEVYFSIDSQKIMLKGTDSAGSIHKLIDIEAVDAADKQVGAVDIETREFDLIKSQASDTYTSPDEKLEIVIDYQTREASLQHTSSYQNQAVSRKITSLKIDPFNYNRPPNKFAFSPNSQHIASASLVDDSIRLWNANGELLSEFKANQGGVEDISFSPDSKQLATIGADGTLRVWQAVADQQLSQRILPSGIQKVAIHVGEDEQLLAMVKEGGLVSVENISVNQLLREFSTSSPSYSITKLLFTNDGSQLIVGDYDGQFQSLNIDDTAPSVSVEISSASFGGQGSFFQEHIGYLLQGVSASPQDYILSFGGERVNVYNSDTKNTISFDVLSSKIEGDVSPSWIYATDFSPDGNLLATAGTDGVVRLWDWTQQELLGDIQANTTRVLSVSFSPDGDWIATAGLDGSVSSVRLWSLSDESKEPISLDGHVGDVTNVIFNPDSSLVATAGSDGTARVWNLQGEQIAQFQGTEKIGIKQQVTELAFSADGQQLTFAYETNDSDRDYQANDSRRYLPEGVVTWEIKDLDELLAQGCHWARGYIESSSVEAKEPVESLENGCEA